MCRNITGIFFLKTNERHVILKKPHTNLWEVDDTVFLKYIRIYLPGISVESVEFLILIYFSTYVQAQTNSDSLVEYQLQKIS